MEGNRLDFVSINTLLEMSCRRFWPKGKGPGPFLPGGSGLGAANGVAGGLPVPITRSRVGKGFPFPGIPSGRSGVYLFRDKNGSVHYVGKAKCLRKRLAQYPLASERLDGDGFQKHMGEIWTSSERVDWLPVPDELGALVLEMDLVGRLKPRFNRALNPPPRRLLWLIHQPKGKRPLRFVADPNQEAEVLFGPIRGGSWTTKVLDALLPLGERENPNRVRAAVGFAKGEGRALLRELEAIYLFACGAEGATKEEVESLAGRIATLKAFDQRRLRQNLALSLNGYFPISPLGPEAWNHPIVPGRKWFYAFWNGRIRGVMEIAASGKFPESMEHLKEMFPFDRVEIPMARGAEEPLLLRAWLDRSPGNSQSFVCAQTAQSTGSAGSA